MREKRGQVTLFIIIGIVLLLAIVLIIVLRSESIREAISPERIFPTETTRITNFIDSCIEDTADQALNLLGAQGGYVYLPPEISNNPLAHLDHGLKVPYWQYVQRSYIPDIGLMEGQLSRYLNQNLKNCLQNLEPFQAEYDIVEKGPILTETEIADETVIFNVEYPIDIINKEGSKITELQDFVYTSPIKLRKVWQVAQEIMLKEIDQEKLERLTIDLISLDPEVPISGVEVSCAQKTWQVAQVEEKLKTLLRTNIPSLRIQKTSYTPVPEDQPYILNHYVWDATDLTYTDIKASFGFDETKPFFLIITPNNGQQLKSGLLQGQEMASFVCLQMWKFNYDVQYPVVVTVEDPENNFNLNYAFEVMVRDNQPDRQAQGQPTQFFNQIGASTEAYCGNRYGEYNIKVNTYDNVSDPTYGETYIAIDDVNITFTCLKYTCPMGLTEYQQQGAIASLETNFPYCANGILRGIKENYKTAQEFVTTSPNAEFNLYLTPLKTIYDYTVVKHPLEQINTYQPLDSDETAFINIQYTKNQTRVHSTSGTYPLNVDQPPMELLAEADFPYQLEVYLMENSEIIGGYQGEWRPAWSELKDSNQIEFHVVSKPSGMSETEFVLNLQNYSNQIPQPIPE